MQPVLDVPVFLDQRRLMRGLDLLAPSTGQRVAHFGAGITGLEQLLLALDAAALPYWSGRAANTLKLVFLRCWESHRKDHFCTFGRAVDVGADFFMYYKCGNVGARVAVDVYVVLDHRPKRTLRDG